MASFVANFKNIPAVFETLTTTGFHLPKPPTTSADTPYNHRGEQTEVMDNFKDFDLQTIARLVSPRRQQVSLLQMQRLQRFKDFFASAKPCIAMTSGGKPYHGHLVYTKNEFQFNFPEALGKVRNGQTLLMAFTMEGVEYCVQVASGQIFPKYFMLRPVQSRYHQRYEVKTPTLVCPVTQRDADAFFTGEYIIRRLRGINDTPRRIRYFIREIVIQINGGLLTEYPRLEAPICTGILNDLSQGGCSIFIKEADEKLFRAWKILYFEATLALGGRIGNLGCFAVVKSLVGKHGTSVLRCAFLEALPLAVGNLRDATHNYGLQFEREIKRVAVNGRDVTSETPIQAKLPQGLATLDIEWAHGFQERRRILITPETPEKILIKAS